MKNTLSRRDFLKLSSALALGYALPRAADALAMPVSQTKPKNIIILVFDALSAYNMPLHGYTRDTTPNLARLAKRAIVYHNHYAASNFTTPGTASLLTGTYPWTHRAIEFGGKAAEEFASKNIFRTFVDHYAIAYTHNTWADNFLRQFQIYIDEHIPRAQLFLTSYDATIGALFKNDEDLAAVSWARTMKVKDYGYAYSLLLSHLYETLTKYQLKGLEPSFPLGFPTSGSDGGFIIEQAIAYLLRRMEEAPKPFIGYFHLLPPHKPYRPSAAFYDAFKGDGYKPDEKPIDEGFTKRARENLTIERRYYDEFILYCDQQFGMLYEALEVSGLLEDTYLILTSDHGEMNERGISGHGTNFLYEPIIRVPLIIFEPGREAGMDIYDNVSSVDVLPTLAHLTGQPVPEWTEGVILPPFARLPERNVYAFRATQNSPIQPLTIGSAAQVTENYKLHYYFGYKRLPAEGMVKLFDIKSDPEEMVDITATKQSVANELFNQLQTKLQEVNQPYLTASAG